MSTTPEQVREWTRMRESGMTIEQVALEAGVSLSTVRRYTPKGIRGRDTTHERNQSNKPSKSTIHLDPTARIANQGYLRYYR